MKRGNFDCEGVISTPQRIKKRTPGFVYDTIVIGAGYAGLSAGRDLAIAGKISCWCKRLSDRIWDTQDFGIQAAPFSYSRAAIAWEVVHTQLKKMVLLASSPRNIDSLS